MGRQMLAGYGWWYREYLPTIIDILTRTKVPLRLAAFGAYSLMH